MSTIVVLNAVITTALEVLFGWVFWRLWLYLIRDPSEHDEEL